MFAVVIEAVGNVRTLMVQYPADPKVQALIKKYGAEILRLAETLPCPLLVDEAYADFADTNCLDLVAALIKRGMANAARIPTITTTIISSIRVNPLFDILIIILSVSFTSIGLSGLDYFQTAKNNFKLFLFRIPVFKLCTGSAKLLKIDKDRSPNSSLQIA